MRGVILYGPPACGKDTITRALHELDSRYVLFPRIKCGIGKILGYRMMTEPALQDLRDRGAIIWENSRYGSVYAVDQPGLIAHMAKHISVVHLGQAPAVDAILATIPDARWRIVALTVPRDIAAERIMARGDPDAAERLKAWDLTEPLPSSDLLIDTSTMAPEEAAVRIARRTFHQ